MKDNEQARCPVEASISIIGGKYKSVILWHLMDSTLRYSQLKKMVVRATPKMLTQQLRELEEDGLVHREVYPVVPPKVEYSLTEKGKTITPILKALYNWSIEYTGEFDGQDLERK